MELTTDGLVDLHDELEVHFDEGELKDLCFRLGVDYENLAGACKKDKVRELVKHCDRMGTMADLLEKCRVLRPKVEWPGANGPGPILASKIVILFLAANPKGTDSLRLGEEVRTTDERLQLAKFRERFELEQGHATRVGDISTALLRYEPHVVHFSGHGSASGDLIFEDETGAPKPVSAKALGTVFRTLKDNVRCVVLNACWSNLQANAIAKEIDCVVGMSRSISDQAAIEFAAGFYQSLAYGKSVQVAFDLGRVQIELQGLSEAATPRLKTKEGVDPARIVLA
jgi:hypothetical protein